MAYVSCAAVLALVILSLFINFLINKQVKKPLDQVLAFLHTVQKGNYAVRLQQKFQCEMLPLSEGLNAMTQAVEEAIEISSREKEKASTEAEKARHALDQVSEKELKLRELMASHARIGCGRGRD